MEWIKREGTQKERPEDLDTTSSKTTVYLRRKQTQIEHEMEDGQKIKALAYEEAEMGKEEWERQQNDLYSPLAKEIMQANNDLIAKNELLQIQVEMLLDLLTNTDGTEGA